jgi:ubiquinone/menaquinone biosynthesis C-methylase UbiE
VNNRPASPRNPEPPEGDPFDRIAPFYDLDFEDFHDDASFYLRLSDIHGPRVLELGCGTGRISVPLAQAGAKVTGVDVSASMLAVARERAGDLPVRWTVGDLRTLRLRGRFDVVCAPLGTLQHMESIDDFVLALESMARHLAPGGVAVVDVESPAAEDFDPTPQPLIEHWTKPWRDGTVSKVVSVAAIPMMGTKEVTWHFDVADRQGRLTRLTTQFYLRTYTPGEIDLAARIAGLRVVARFGDYEFAPHYDGAERLVVLLQRADDDVAYQYGEEPA